MEPQLTAVLTIRTDYRRARRLFQSLREQELAGLELVMVAPQRILDRVTPDDLGGILFRPVPLEDVRTGAYGWAAGVQHASAPWIVLVEDHCFPEPDWAQSLLRATADPEVLAVGPRVLNGNPATLWSRVDILLNFSEFLGDEPGRRVRLCGHNTCYRRAILPDDPKELEEVLESEAAFHERLADRGGRLEFEPRARVYHVNISEPISFFRHKVLGGILFGGARSRDWSLRKRAIYVLGSPLIPFLRVFRLLSILRPALLADLEKRRWPLALVMLWAALLAHGMGEALGYLVGHARAARLYPTYSGIELDRYANVAVAERAVLEMA